MLTRVFRKNNSQHGQDFKCDSEYFSKRLNKYVYPGFSCKIFLNITREILTEVGILI